MTAFPTEFPPLLACPHCDLVHRDAGLPAHAEALCTRCGAALHGAGEHSVDHALALALAAAVLCVFVNVFPLIRFNLQGAEAATTIAGAAWGMAERGMWGLAGLVAWGAMLAPALMLAAMLYVLLPLRLGSCAPGFAWAMRVLRAVQPWVMVEVLMLGVLVSFVKLDKTGVVVASEGAWLGVMLMLVLAGLGVAFEPRVIWRHYEALRPAARGGPARAVRPVTASAAASDLAVCEVCGLISAAHGAGHRCLRCGAAVHLRQPQSLSRCLALLLTSLMLYFPANLWTIMETESAFSVREDTIMSGVIFLWHEGSQDLAVIVFVASVVVPLLKILALGALLGCVYWKWPVPRVQQARLYRLVEFVGKWSMLDLFVIALLTAVVDFGSFAAVRPGPAAVAFGAVVVLTMLAASAFDPRFIWDAQDSALKDPHG